ncbi:uncharacterized protein LOC131892249 [Tigriopus californicus]|uniref:uncharacterized protein LOC131892249 n=1 Tax=Tigriopus californicus TaxID=6832 RepID=UPI0027DA4351|nr:uncharacterized protein LOC131892249 [Tigriopus californicus]
MGGIILFFTLVLFLMVPNVKPGSSSKSKDLANGSKPCLTIRNVIQSFSLSLPFLDKFILFCGNGMLESMLQPHMINSEAQATQFEVSMAFLIMATCYVVICPIVGHVCDGMKRPILLSIVGNCFLVVAFIFIGPAPFITRLPTSVPLIFGMMPLFGLANGLVAVSSFSRAYKESIRQGYRDDVSTYLIVTGKIEIENPYFRSQVQRLLIVCSQKFALGKLSQNLKVLDFLTFDSVNKHEQCRLTELGLFFLKN